MNYKQKLGYTLLGAGVMALGIIIGQWGTPDIEAQSNGVFDTITCRELEVVDAEGKKAIVLTSLQSANYVFVYDKQENIAIRLVSSQGGNSVDVRDKQGEAAISLTSLQSANLVDLHDKQGETAIRLTNLQERNHVLVKNNLTGEFERLD